MQCAERFYETFHIMFTNVYCRSHLLLLYQFARVNLHKMSSSERNIRAIDPVTTSAVFDISLSADIMVTLSANQPSSRLRKTTQRHEMYCPCNVRKGFMKRFT